MPDTQNTPEERIAIANAVIKSNLSLLEQQLILSATFSPYALNHINPEDRTRIFGHVLTDTSFSGAQKVKICSSLYRPASSNEPTNTSDTLEPTEKEKNVASSTSMMM